MMHDNWKVFPELLTKKINSLLFAAEPTQIKSYQLYKACKSENLWRNSFELFSVHLTDYYSLPERERSKSYFDKYLDRPMNRYLYEEFELNFRTAIIKANAILEIADWAHSEIKFHCVIDSAVNSVDVLAKTLEYITKPPSHEKDRDIEFDDFCRAWKKTVHILFGKKYENELIRLINEINWFHEQKDNELKNEIPKITYEIYLTQTEIDWTTSVLNAVSRSELTPKYPLTRGAEKIELQELLRTTTLYNLIIKQNRIEFLEYIPVVKNTILDKCNRLLKICRR